MKKAIIIVCLFVFNICVVYAKICEKKLDNVDIKLKDDELGIITIMLDNSSSLLLKYKDYNILYIIDYVNGTNLKSSVDLFAKSIDYVFMLNNYDYTKLGYGVTDNQTIDDLTLMRNKIIYKDKLICINQSADCDLVFINREDVLLNKDVESVFYSNQLSEKYIDYIKSFWLDEYRLSKQSYTIVTMGDEYQVNNLVK